MEVEGVDVFRRRLRRVTNGLSVVGLTAALSIQAVNQLPEDIDILPPESSNSDRGETGDR